ncbi:ribonuclease BN [Achromatium sp. WMS2]|nr:ribonuclease BN [Achromatium sp. WMS2]
MQLVWRIVHFNRFVGYRFIADGGLHHTANLTYTTLLSLVPLMTVSLALFAAFPIGDRVVNQIQDFVFKNFVPTSGEIIREYLQQFSDKASRLTGTGSIFLVLVAILMMANIDFAFNTIWHVKRRRNLIANFTMYWAILSLGPIFIGVSVLLTSYLEAMPFFIDAAARFKRDSSSFDMMPVVASSIAFTLLYSVVPNRNVPFLHAVGGGLVAGLLFEASKRGFAWYVAAVPYQAIYGALAAIPVFLIWIYLSWLVTLLGCEITYCLGAYRDNWTNEYSRSGTNMLLAYRILGRLWDAQHKGLSLSMERLLAAEIRHSETELENLLLKLVKARLVLRTERGEWALARDLAKVSMLDLYQTGPFILPTDCGEEPELTKIFSSLDEGLRKALNVPLASLYQSRQESTQ